MRYDVIKSCSYIIKMRCDVSLVFILRFLASHHIVKSIFETIVIMTEGIRGQGNDRN